MQNKFKAILATLIFSMALSVGAFASSVVKTVNHQDIDTHADVVENIAPYTYSGNYYDSINADNLSDGLNGELRTSLTSHIYPKGFYTYSGDGPDELGSILQEADEDPNNSSNMVLFYTHNSITKVDSSGGSNWNREHCWPKNLSDGNWDTSKAGADLLHIRPTYSTTNSERSNLKYGTVSSGSVLTYNNMQYGKKNSTYFEPMDFSKGDAARIIMYIWTAYKNTYSNLPEITKTFSSYEEMIEWHILDVPDKLEGNRNDYSETSKQKNRNPYVDHPEWGCRVFKDKISSSLYNECMETYKNGGQSSVVPTSIDIVTSNTTLIVGEERKLTVNVSPSNANKSVTWSSSNSSVVSVSNDGTINALKAGSAIITATSALDTNVKDNITFTVKEVSSISIDGTPNKTSYYEGEKFNPLGLTVTANYNDGSTASVSVNDCLWYDGTTNQETLSEGTTSVVCRYGNVYTTYSGISVSKAVTPTTITYNFIDKSWNTSENVEWTGDDAFGYEGQDKQRGVQTNGNTGLIVKSPIEFNNVKKITIGTCTNGSGSIALSVGKTSVGTITPSSGSIAAKSLEVNGLSGYVSFEITNKRDSVYIKYITIESGSSSGGDITEPTIAGIKVTSNPNKTTYTIGDTLDLAGLVIHTYDENDNNLENVTNACNFNPSEGTVLNNAGTISVNVSYQGLVTSFSVTVNEQGGGEIDPDPDVPVEGSTFVKVTENKTDWTGTYLIVYESESLNLAFNGAKTTEFDKNNTKNVNINNDKTIDYSDTLFSSTVVIEKATTSNKYYVKTASGHYIGNTGTSNTVSEVKDPHTISIDINNNNNNNYNIFLVASGGNNMEYNVKDGFFRYYKEASNQKDITLYELIAPEITPESEAKTFATTFLNTRLCDGGVNAPKSTLWNDLANEFSLLSNEAKEIFRTGNSSDADILDAIARYDYILKKYGEDPQHGGYDNFMNRTITNNSPAVNFDLFGDASTIIVSFITVVILLASIGLIVSVIQKRRRENK